MSHLLDCFQGLGNFKAGKIYYYPNNGNAGDALLNMGFYALAEKYNFKYQEISKNHISKINKNDVLVIAGGGAMVPEWGATTELVRNLDKDITLIILPQSIREVDDVISNLPKDTTIFCREKYSYEYCLNKSNAKNVYLEDDIAFNCDVNKIFNSSLTRPVIKYKDVFRHVFLYLHKCTSIYNKKIYAMRVDKEKSSSLNVPRSIHNDFSLIASFGSGNYEESVYSAYKFLKLIDLYEEIHTDRLHVAIGASLLGKKVYMYNNGYYKCKGVYEKSMKHLPNVSFIE